MSKNLFELAEACLFSASIKEKLQCCFKAQQLLETNSLEVIPSASSLKTTKPIEDTCFPNTPVWVPARELPKRGIGSQEGRTALLHAVAHIEFIAIHLAWDIVYRFPNMPAKFHIDWINVAIDEARHFQLIERRLNSLGHQYGDMPVHGGLWEMATDTQNDILARLALIPRYMEARGLDVTPEMIKKFTKYNDTDSVAVLEVILDEEIDHVRKGDFWFKNQCQLQNLDFESTYFEMLDKYLKGDARGPFNRELRLQAGFSIREFEVLSAHYSNNNK